MPYTVHTPDGQAHTYPDPVLPEVSHDGQVLTMRTLPKESSWEHVEGWPVSVYAPGQWTHLYLHPTPYETDYSSTDATRDAQEQAEQARGMTANAEAWATQFQSHINAGRKAAETQ